MKASNLNDIAVLYRAHYHAVELQLELSRRGIPYQITSGIRFFEQAHIKDVASFIRFVANPRDEVAFKRMVQIAARHRRTKARTIFGMRWEKSCLELRSCRPRSKCARRPATRLQHRLKLLNSVGTRSQKIVGTTGGNAR